MVEPYHGWRGEVLFIDARNMGVLRDRTHRELTDDEVQKIADTYHAWRGERVEAEDTKMSPASVRPPPLMKE